MTKKKENKLIAEFMGWYKPDDEKYYIHKFSEKDYTDNELEYHTSWDWLMPVIQKCLDISNDDKMIEDFYSIQNVVPNIDATYNAVVKFINEYRNDER